MTIVLQHHPVALAVVRVTGKELIIALKIPLQNHSLPLEQVLAHQVYPVASAKATAILTMIVEAG